MNFERHSMRLSDFLNYLLIQKWLPRMILAAPNICGLLQRLDDICWRLLTISMVGWTATHRK